MRRDCRTWTTGAPRSPRREWRRILLHVPETHDGTRRPHSPRCGPAAPAGRLDELFLIVVVGEFNAGKSALVNALLGSQVLAEGVTPTTTHVTLVKYGETVQETLGHDELAQLTFPLDFLRELNIVDTPGTNAVIRRHEELTRDFIPRSDLVLFVTSADRPFTESERQFMEHIREWGKKIVVVINKRDILETDQARAQVLAFVRANAQQLLGFAPEVFIVSAKRDQIDGKLTGGMADLYHYVLSWLDESARLRVKGPILRELNQVVSPIRRIGEAWRPYRSVASWYLWRSLDNE